MDALERLLEGNDEHVADISVDHFAGVRDAQKPAAVSISCSDSRVPTEGVWSARSDGDLFTGSNVGNQVWADIGGERVVNDVVGYAVSVLGVDLVAVVGHTGCGAVTAAYDAVFGNGDGSDAPPAVAAAVERLVPVAEDARTDGIVDADTVRSDAINRLVEYAVREQVAFLVDGGDVPSSVTVAGFVYDFQHAYGNADGTANLVSLDGETDQATIRERLDPAFHDHVGSLLPE